MNKSCIIFSPSNLILWFSLSPLGRSPLQQEASPTVSQGGSSSSSPLSARGKLVNMVRVFKEDIQKRKDESDRKSGKGGSGAPKFIFCLFVFFATLNLSNVFFGHYVIRIGNPFSSYSIDLNVWGISFGILFSKQFSCDLTFDRFTMLQQWINLNVPKFSR